MSDRMELIETEFAICFPWKKRGFTTANSRVSFKKKTKKPQPNITKEFAYGIPVKLFHYRVHC